MFSDFSKVALLVNSRSRTGNTAFEEAKKLLEERGVNLDVAKSYKKVEELVKDLKNYTEHGSLAIVGGGDGTINAAVNELALTKGTLGVLPLGTGNAFARDLGISSEPSEAIETILEGQTEQVDLGEINGKYFVNVATMGLTADIARMLSVPLKRRFGRFVYAIALQRAVKNIEPFQLKLESPAGNVDIQAVQVVIGNGRHHAGPFLISPTAALSSGNLVVYVLEAGAKKELIKYALLLPIGLHGMLKSVRMLEVKSGSVSTEPPRTIIVDGEQHGETPAQFKVHHLALNVRTPQNFKG